MIGQNGLVQRAHLRIALLLRELAQGIDVIGGGAFLIAVRRDRDLPRVVPGLGVTKPGGGATGRGETDGDDACETQGERFLCVFHFSMPGSTRGTCAPQHQRDGVEAPSRED